MKHLNLIGFIVTTFLIVLGCCKQPPPCNPAYFVDTEFTAYDQAGVYDYSLIIKTTNGEFPGVSTWYGNEADTGHYSASDEITGYFDQAGDDVQFRMQGYIPTGNQTGLFVFSDWYAANKYDTAQARRIETPEKVILVAQGRNTPSGSIWVDREGGHNKIKVSNFLRCPVQAKLTYNGKDTTLNLNASPETGNRYEFENNDSIFEISYQALTPCEFYQVHDVLTVSSSSIQPFDFSGLKIGVRKEDCETIKR